MRMSLTKGLFIGSMVGVAFSLFDKQTRTQSVQNIRNWKETATDLKAMTNSINRTSEKIKSTAVKLSDDATFVVEKLEELKEITPVVAGIIRETKDTFSTEGRNQQERKLTSSIQYLP
ncbi:hypothetical protein [Bacillus sp. B1-b2]|uniref:hypothetical protein n=1 Tax=Bacillus sp. B1-b2 TaxID=2653201 RepID=UPI001261A2CF|nr:hypothetical protein [Bacillus sp. B1-b2]KAB7672530.1 hypothetical protein F9279_02565 [Bacillus sp. B1-b2]